MPELRTFNTKHGSMLVSIAADPPEDMITFIKEKQLNFPVLYDPNGDVFALYGVRGVPTTFVIDSTGKVVNQIPGPVTSKQLEKLIEGKK